VSIPQYCKLLRLDRLQVPFFNSSVWPDFRSNPVYQLCDCSDFTTSCTSFSIGRFLAFHFKEL